MLNIYPHPELPLFPKRLLPFVKGQRINVEGMGEISVLKLTRIKPGDLPKNHRKACISAVVALMRSLFAGKQKENLVKITLQVSEKVRICDLQLTQKAQASLGDSPFFRSTGPWRRSSLIENREGCNTHVGPLLYLALLLASESISQRFKPIAKESTLETELRSIVKTVVHFERNASVFLRAHGWHGKGQESLADIAKQLKLTHERVRQIVRSTEQSMYRHSLQAGELTHLRKAIAVLAANTPMKCSDGAILLKEQKISSSLFDIQGVLDAAQFFGIATGMDRWVWEGKAFARRFDAREDELPIVMGVGLAQTLSQLYRDVKHALRHEGAIHIDSEAERLKTKYGVSQNIVRFVFQIYANGKSCNNEKEWFITFSSSERVQKIHAFLRWSGNQSLLTLKHACDKSKLFSNNPPIEVLDELLEKTGLFKIEKKKISITNPNAFDNRESVKIENLIMSALNEVGGKMHRHVLRHRLISESEKGKEVAKQLRSSLLFRVEGKNVKKETISDDRDLDAFFVTSMDQGIDFRAFAENMLMGTPTNIT